MSIGVLVIDDSPLAQRWLADLVLAEPGFALAGTASNGLAGLELAQGARPGLVTLDLRMPVMDGLTMLKHLMTTRPTPTVVVSSFATDESTEAFECLRYGAVDLMAKPTSVGGAPEADHQQELLDRLRQAASVATSRLRYQRLHRRPLALPLVGRRIARRLIVALAGRTGLAQALSLLAATPCNPELAVVVLLDASRRVVDSFAQYAARYSSVNVTTAGHGTSLEGATAYLIAAGEPLAVIGDTKCLRFAVFERPAETRTEALVSGFVRSVAESFGRHLTVVVLSGATPGVEDGLESVRLRGGALTTQDLETALEPKLLAAVTLRLGARQIATWDELAGFALKSPKRS